MSLFISGRRWRIQMPLSFRRACSGGRALPARPFCNLSDRLPPHTTGTSLLIHLVPGLDLSYAGNHKFVKAICCRWAYLFIKHFTNFCSPGCQLPGGKRTVSEDLLADLTYEAAWPAMRRDNSQLCSIWPGPRSSHACRGIAKLAQNHLDFR